MNDCNIIYVYMPWRLYETKCNVTQRNVYTVIPLNSLKPIVHRTVCWRTPCLKKRRCVCDCTRFFRHELKYKEKLCSWLSIKYNLMWYQNEAKRVRRRITSINNINSWWKYVHAITYDDERKVHFQLLSWSVFFFLFFSIPQFPPHFTITLVKEKNWIW